MRTEDYNSMPKKELLTKELGDFLMPGNFYVLEMELAGKEITRSPKVGGKTKED